MQQSTYDPCLLYINKKGFGVVDLQIDNTLILKDEIFANVENFHLYETKLLAKEKEKLTSQYPIKLNSVHIKQKSSQPFFSGKFRIPPFKSRTSMQKLTID